jgi:hypothetical protein
VKILENIRNRRASAETPAAQRSSPDPGPRPFPGYDRLDHKAIGLKLSELSQVELAAVESYERAHQDRTEVLAKLRYMRMSEPMADYDTLDAEQINETLGTADAETVKAVRDYERKFGRRRQVLDRTASVLPTATASPGEDRAREGQAARVRDGFAGRDKTAGDLANRRPERP